MRELKDGHVNLITPFDYGRYWDWNTKYPENYNEALVKNYLGDEYRIAGGLSYTQLKYNIIQRTASLIFVIVVLLHLFQPAMLHLH